MPRLLRWHGPLVPVSLQKRIPESECTDYHPLPEKNRWTCCCCRLSLMEIIQSHCVGLENGPAPLLCVPDMHVYLDRRGWLLHQSNQTRSSFLTLVRSPCSNFPIASSSSPGSTPDSAQCRAYSSARVKSNFTSSVVCIIIFI